MSMSTAKALRKGRCSDPSGIASLSSSRRNLIDYTKNRARFLGERRRKKTSLCSDFHAKIDRAPSRATDNDEESASISTADSTELVVFYLRSRFRRVVEDDLESHVAQDEDDLVSQMGEIDDDLVSHVSESETPSEASNFGYLPGAIRKITDTLSSPRYLRASLRKVIENDDESGQGVGVRDIDTSSTENDHSCASYCSYSESSSRMTSVESQEGSSVCCRSVRSSESLELGLLNHSFFRSTSCRRGYTVDDSQESVTSGSVSNTPRSHKDNKSFRSISSRSTTGKSLDSLASSFLLIKTPTSHKGGKLYTNVSGCHIRSNHVHTPSSVKTSKYLQPFTPTKSDHDHSQRSARSLGSNKPGKSGDKTVSLRDFFRKEEVKRFNPSSSKRSMKSVSQKSSSQNKTKSAETTPRRKRASSDLSAPETPVTASMTSQTMSTPSRSGLWRSSSDRGDSLLAELNQTLKQGLLFGLDDGNDITDDASVANSEALVSLMDDLRHVSKSTRALDTSGGSYCDDTSSCLGHISLARSASEKPFLSDSHSDVNLSQSEIDNLDWVIKAATCNFEGFASAPQTKSLQWTRRYQAVNETSVEERVPNKESSSRIENCGDFRFVNGVVMIGGPRDTSRIAENGATIHQKVAMPQSEDPVTSKRMPPVKTTTPPAGFLIQPKVLPLKRLPKGTLPFAQLLDNFDA